MRDRFDSRWVITLALLLAVGCATSFFRSPKIGSFGIDLSARDTSVSPGADFFGYANGAWLERYELADDESRYGPLVGLRYEAERNVRRIIEDLERSDPRPGSIERKIVDYYASFMDEAALDARGVGAIASELSGIERLSNGEQLRDVLALAPITGTQAPFAAVVGIDRKNPDQHQLALVATGLGLPDRSFYLEDPFAEIRDQYRSHMARMLDLSGMASEESEAAAASVLDLETAMARHHWPRSELRDREKTYNLYTLVELGTAFPNVDWPRFLGASGFDVAKIDAINVISPSAIAPLIALLDEFPIETWRNYLRFHLVASHAPLLGREIDEAAFEFEGKVLSGQLKQRERWKRALAWVAGMQHGGPEGFGEAVGRLYVERHFPERSRRAMLSLVEELRAAFRDRIQSLDWMGDETRAEALAKLEGFRVKIGYPDEWRSFAEVEIVEGDLMANYRAMSGYWYRDMVQRLGRPTDRGEWGMTPQTVNAYYNPTFNEIVFPAAILQPPFFDANADAAVNYGAIGAVIGHEMGHGFDDQGSKSDAKGIERNWWSDEDRRRFDARGDRLVELFSQYEAVAGHPLDGRLTLGENIGDLGGVSIALHAYHRSLGFEPAPVIDGFTGDQRFFLAWAQAWRSKARDEILIQLAKRDPHSPPRFRVNGIVPHLDAWYAAFDVSPDDALYLAPEERVRIW